VLGAVERRAWALWKPEERAPRVDARGMICLNMAAMCRKRVGEVRGWRGAAALGVRVVAQRDVDG
jgi:hypothetical protein